MEDGGLGEGDADDALEGDDFVDDFVLFQFGRHAAGEPDDAEDAEGRGEGFDDAEGGGGSREFELEGTQDGAEDPVGEVEGHFGGEDLEDHDPDHLWGGVGQSRKKYFLKGEDDGWVERYTLNQRKLPLSCLGLFLRTP